MWWLISRSLALTSASRSLPSGPPSLLALRLCSSQPEALLLQLRDPVADLSSPAHVLASMIPRSLISPAHSSIHYHKLWIAPVQQRGV
jgi:hypothetical protein